MMRCCRLCILVTMGIVWGPFPGGVQEAFAAPSDAPVAPRDDPNAPRDAPSAPQRPTEDVSEPPAAPDGAGEPAPVPAGLPEDTKSWDPPAANEKWDWVLLTTGEWLKGTLEIVRDGSMSFDSGQFGLTEIDLDDVAAFYAFRPHIYQLDDRSTRLGKGTLRGEELRIGGAVVPRARLMGVVDGTPRELNYWSLKVNASLSLRGGNTQQMTLSDYLFIRRDAAQSRLTLESNGSYGKLDAEVTVQTQTGLAQFDVFVSKRFYVTPALFTGTHDRFQNIDARTIAGSGIGVHAVDRDGFEWDFEASGGHQYLNYRTVEMGQDPRQHDAVARMGTRVSADVGGPLDVDLAWTTTLIATDIGQTFHHGSLALQLEITDIFDSTISLIYDRVEDPVPREDGTIPVSDDVQLNFGVQIGI